MERVAELESMIKKLEGERTSVFRKLQPLQDRVREIDEALQPLIEERDQLKISAHINSQEIDFKLLMDGDPKSRYREQGRQLSMLRLDRSGYWVDTGQTAVRISLFTKDDAHTHAVHESLKRILPHIQPHESCDGKPIRIFDHRLHADGGWDLVVHEDNTVSLIVGGIHRNRVYTTFPSLLEALKYCQKNNYYEKGKAPKGL